MFWRHVQGWYFSFLPSLGEFAGAVLTLHLDGAVRQCGLASGHGDRAGPRQPSVSTPITCWTMPGGTATETGTAGASRDHSVQSTEDGHLSLPGEVSRPFQKQYLSSTLKNEWDQSLGQWWGRGTRSGRKPCVQEPAGQQAAWLTDAVVSITVLTVWENWLSWFLYAGLKHFIYL